MLLKKILKKYHIMAADDCRMGCFINRYICNRKKQQCSHSNGRMFWSFLAINHIVCVSASGKI